MLVEPDFARDAVDVGRTFAAATLFEAMGKTGEVGPDIRPMVPGLKLSGLAHTVRCPIGDARGLWTAIASAAPGSVIIADAGGSSAATAIGATSVRAAIRRGIAGFVVNGAVRDLAEMRALGLPVFAAGSSVRGTQKAHPGWHGQPVAIGAAVIAQGDLVVGDDDGLVCVARSQFPELRARAERQAAREAQIDGRIDAGEDVLDVLGLR